MYLFFSEWRHPASKNISVATCNGLQIALAVGKQLYYLEIDGESLNEIRYAELFCCWFSERCMKEYICSKKNEYNPCFLSSQSKSNFSNSIEVQKISDINFL